LASFRIHDAVDRLVRDVREIRVLNRGASCHFAKRWRAFILEEVIGPL
jgi:hypothetical protein